MTLQERLHAAEVRSVEAYQRRSRLAQQQMALQSEAQRVDLALAVLDGECECLRALIAEARDGK